MVDQVTKLATSSESDDQIMERIATRFQILDDMTRAAIAGDIRAMIVSGPPGVGKSYGIERQLDKANLFDRIAGRKVKSEIFKGASTALGLYMSLFKYSEANCVAVFDDCDTILSDEVSLNLLKGALDSSKRRRISWLGESYALRKEDVPNQFDFKGTVIFITNLKFDQIRSQKIRNHLDALQSRCHYLDLTLDTMRDKFLRIRQIANTGQLFENYDFDQKTQELIIDYLSENAEQWREMSLRMALKVADLYRVSNTNWQALARATCMKPGFDNLEK